jgi:hypothetical protein
VKRLSLEQIDAAIKRDTSRMTRIANRLAKWHRMRQRKLVEMAKPARRLADEVIQDVAAQVKPLKQAMAAAGVVAIPADKIGQAVAIPVEHAFVTDDPLDVRDQPWSRRNEADETAKAEIIATQAATKKVKTKASSEKSRAKQRGELRKMPLQGKAAVDFIRGK